MKNRRRGMASLTVALLSDVVCQTRNAAFTGHGGATHGTAKQSLLDLHDAKIYSRHLQEENLYSSRTYASKGRESVHHP